MRFTLIVVVNNFQTKIRASLRKGGSNIRDIRAPFPAKFAIHQIFLFVVLQPEIRLQPRRPETTALPANVGLHWGGFGSFLGCLNDGALLRRGGLHWRDTNIVASLLHVLEISIRPDSVDGTVCVFLLSRLLHGGRRCFQVLS